EEREQVVLARTVKADRPDADHFVVVLAVERGHELRRVSLVPRADLAPRADDSRGRVEEALTVRVLPDADQHVADALLPLLVHRVDVSGASLFSKGHAVMMPGHSASPWKGGARRGAG